MAACTYLNPSPFIYKGKAEIKKLPSTSFWRDLNVLRFLLSFSDQFFDTLVAFCEIQYFYCAQIKSELELIPRGMIFGYRIIGYSKKKKKI